jgi:hypothetical protein
MARWMTSSICDTANSCVEVMLDGDSVRVRDSKDCDGPVLTFSTQEWESFTDAIKNGELQ